MLFPFLFKVQIGPVKKKKRRENPQTHTINRLCFFYSSLIDDTLPHGGVVLGLEPLDRIGLVNAVGGTDVGLASSALGDTKTRAGPVWRKTLALLMGETPAYSSSPPFPSTFSSQCRSWGDSHDAVKVHSVNTDGRVVLDAQIDVLRDTETEVSSLGEVLLAQLVLLDLQATFDDLLGLGPADGNVHSDLLVTTDTKGTDSVACLAVHRCLTGKLLEHLSGTCEPISGFADGDIENCVLLVSEVF